MEREMDENLKYIVFHGEKEGDEDDDGDFTVVGCWRERRCLWKILLRWERIGLSGDESQAI